MKTPRYTAQQVIDALTETKGLVYLAAQRLQCDPDTIMNYCKRHPSVEAAKVAARGVLLDVCELKLWAAVQRGDAWAIAFALRTIGKHRGYVERQEVSGADGGPVVLTGQPEWQRLRHAILAALADLPEARLRLAEVLEENAAYASRNGTGH